MYRDSFGRALYPYLAERFKEASFSRKDDYDPTALAPGGCLVIELCERNLNNLPSAPIALPAPERDAALVKDAAAGEGVSKIVLAKGGPEGYTVLCGDLGGHLPEDDSPVYLETGGTLYEALPGAEDYRLCLPEEAMQGSLRVYFRSAGGWICLEGRVEN